MADTDDQWFNQRVSELRGADDPVRAFGKLSRNEPLEAIRLYEEAGDSPSLAQVLTGDRNNRDRSLRRYYQQAQYRADRSVDELLQDTKSAVQDALHKERGDSIDIETLADDVNASPEVTKAACHLLVDEGFCVQRLSDSLVTMPKAGGLIDRPLKVQSPDTELTVGVVSDTHIGSKYAALEYLNEAYDAFADEGVTMVFHSGDLFDGPGHYGYRGHANEVLENCQRWYGCLKEVHNTYPQRDGITTYFIESSNSHAGWEYKASGRELGVLLDKGHPSTPSREGVAEREDLVYLGMDKRTMKIGPENNTKVELYHPSGSTAYARSYKPQKYINNMPGGRKPNLLIIGHYHVFNFMVTRNVHCVMMPGMQHSTPYIIAKQKHFEVGYCILDLELTAEGDIVSCNPRTHWGYYEEE